LPSGGIPSPRSASPAVTLASPFPAPTDATSEALREIPLQRPELGSGDCAVTESRTRRVDPLGSLDVFGNEPLFVEGEFPNYDSHDAAGHAYARMRFLRDTLYRTYFLVRGANLETGEPILFRMERGEPTDELWLLGLNAEEPQPNYENQRSWIVDVGVPSPGCYVMQADGPGHFGSVVIVFEVP
jgi:hypothetical protein